MKKAAFRSLLSIAFVAVLLVSPIRPAAADDDVDRLSEAFWAWRKIHQPLTGDDIPRLDRAPDWLPDWSPESIAAQRRSLTEFENRWKRLDVTGLPVAKQVDYRLIGSAIARVRWELDINPNWQRNAMFYLDQTLGSIFDRLLQPPPFSAERSTEIVRRMERIPRTLTEARQNLTTPVRPYAAAAIGLLADIRPRLHTVARELKPFLSRDSAGKLDGATDAAILALEGYREWLTQKLPEMSSDTAVGRDAYLYFLKSVALNPYSPEELLAMGRQEWERSVAFETYEQNRNTGRPQLKIFPTQAAQIARNNADERSVRRFLEAHNILTVPAWVRHYRNLPLPKYLEPLQACGVVDDLTGPTRLGMDGVKYIGKPSPNLGYFSLSTARDPRPIIVHEGVPGHYFQLVLSWAHENPIRRYYYDSGSNEGIGFYAEELMLNAGLFDDSPRTREIIYNFMRLRALRVEVDVKLALGQFTIEQAGDYLAKTVPMDEETARAEAVFFAATPGQAITYQIGKIQILKFLADARRIRGKQFSLRDFHDFVWKNGNVPIVLQRWEYLGLTDEIEKLK